MKFRPAIESDAESLASLVNALGYPSTPSEMTIRLESFPPSHLTFVAEIDGHVAGFVGLCLLPIYESSMPIGYVLALSVAPAFRQRGVGRFLMEAAEAWLLQKGIRDVRLSSGFQREAAHSFYERCGYSKTGYRLRKFL